MFGYTLLTTALALSAVVAQSGLPDCAANPQSCKCPFDIELSDSTTVAVIGAATQDVKAIIGSFFQTDWFGSTPESTSGVDNKPGSTRTYVGETTVGTYEFVEGIVTYEEKKDGSFRVLFQQENGPVQFDNGQGYFAGYWDVLEIKSIAPHETYIYWNIYACFTGMPADFAAFHESGINNVTSLLKAQGKHVGRALAPISF